MKPFDPDRTYEQIVSELGHDVVTHPERGTSYLVQARRKNEYDEDRMKKALRIMLLVYLARGITGDDSTFDLVTSLIKTEAAKEAKGRKALITTEADDLKAQEVARLRVRDQFFHYERFELERVLRDGPDKARSIDTYRVEALDIENIPRILQAASPDTDSSPRSE